MSFSTTTGVHLGRNPQSGRRYARWDEYSGRRLGTTPGDDVGRGAAERGDVLEPFLGVLEGSIVPYTELVDAGRMIARAMVALGRPIVISTEDTWAGVWDLERLTDREAVAWGFWVVSRLEPTGNE
jgi:hypothetical protein